MEPLLSVIIVNYNSGDMLGTCLASIEQNTRCSAYEVIVIDNNSRDGSCEAACARFPWVRLIRNRKNRGFAAASNQGILASRAPYLLFLNPDTIVMPYALDKMLSFMQQRPYAAALGCKLLNPDGSLQPSCSNSFLSVKQVLLRMLARMLFLEHWLDRLLPNLAYPGRLKLTPRQHEQIRTVEHVVGAAVMVRRTTVDKVGMLDEGYFLYLEDTDWCYRMRTSGLVIYYLPEAEITHFVGGSTKSSIDLRFNEREVYIYRGKLRFFEKHRPPWEQKLYRLLLVAIICVKLTLAGMAWLVGARRREMRSRISGYLRILGLVLSGDSAHSASAEESQSSGSMCQGVSTREDDL